MTAKLIRLRLNADGDTQGLTGHGLDVFHVNHSDKVIAFLRFAGGGPGDDCIVIANFSSRNFDDYRIGLPSSGTWHRRFCSDSGKWSDEFWDDSSASIESQDSSHEGKPFAAAFSLPPYSLLIYSQRKKLHDELLSPAGMDHR